MPSLFDMIEGLDRIRYPQAKWPPVYPADEEWATKPADERSAEEWREYVGFLLVEGYRLKRQLVAALEKLDRRPRQTTFKSFNSASPSTASRTGRPRDEAGWQQASEAYALRRSMGLNNNIDALMRWYVLKGRRPTLVKSEEGRAVLSKMSKLHTESRILKNRNG